MYGAQPGVTKDMIPPLVQRVTDLFCENLRRYLAGEELLNVIDKQHGY